MKLDDIHDQWTVDCTLDKTDLSSASRDVPKLHSKYLRIFSGERMRLRSLEEQRKSLVKLKHDYYRGLLSPEELQENGWDPFQLSVLKSDLPMYIEADKDIIELNLKIAIQQEKVDVLESILRSINNRGYLIKGVIDWEKFQMGA